MKKSAPPIHPLLFAAYPALFLYAHNIDQVPPGAVVVPLALLLITAAGLWALLRLALRTWTKGGLILSMGLVVFFSYGHLYEAIEPVRIELAGLVLGPNKAILGLSVLALAPLVCVCVKSHGDLHNGTRIANTVAVVLMVMPVAKIGAHAVSAAFGRHDGPTPAPSVVIDTTAGGQKPDIYYIIVDAYARADVLRDVYGFDNTPFIDFLISRGFYVADQSRSNYAQTFLSLASTLNLRYFDDIEQIVNPQWKHRKPIIDLLHANVTFPLLERQGYALAAFSSGFYATEITGGDRYLCPQWTLDEFSNELLSSTPLGSLLGEFGIVDQYEVHRRRVLYMLDRLPDAPLPDRPTFVFAHIASPHAPFVFGPDGQRRNRDLPFEYTDGDHLVRDGRYTHRQYTREYADQVRFLNKRLREVIDAILARRDRPAVIVLQADHGPRSMLKWEDVEGSNMTECMSILNAYYAPGHASIPWYPSITPVNTFRLLFNHYFGTTYERLPDRSFYSSARYPYKFIDVTRRMDAEARTTMRSWVSGNHAR